MPSPMPSLAEIRTHCLACLPSLQSDSLSAQQRVTLAACEAIRDERTADFPSLLQQIHALSWSDPLVLPIVIYLYVHEDACRESGTEKRFRWPALRLQLHQQAYRDVLRPYWGYYPVTQAIIQQDVRACATAYACLEGVAYYKECLFSWLDDPKTACPHLLVHALTNPPGKSWDWLLQLKPYAGVLRLDCLFHNWSQQCSAPENLLFYCFAYRPDLAPSWGSAYLRRFPRHERLALLLAKPAGLTSEDRLAFRAWQVAGFSFDQLFSSGGLNIEEPVPTRSWNWQPRKLVLPGGTLTVDEFGLLKGSQRIAWRVASDRLLCYQSPSNEGGRLLAAVERQYALQLYWAYPIVKVTTETTVQDLILTLLCLRPQFTVSCALLDFLQPTKHYKQACAAVKPLLPLWARFHLYGSTSEALAHALHRLGTATDFVRLQAHFPSFTPPARVTTEVT